VTGQRVLGARAGASSMVNSMIGGTASDASRAASSGVQGDMSMKLRSNAATIAQGSEAKAMAAQGFAAKALGYSVKGLEEGRAASEAGAGIAGLGRIEKQLGNSRDTKQAQFRAATASGATVGDLFKANGNWSAAQAAIDNAKNGTPLPGANNGPGGPGSNAPTKTAVAADGAKSVFGAADAIYAADLTDDMGRTSRGLNAQAAGLDMRSFEANANAAQLRQAEGNMGRYADFSAKNAAWHDRNAFANQVGGWSAALGIQTGNVDPGAKPNDMTGMAMSGMLRTSDGKNAAGGHAWHLDWTAGGHRQGTSDAKSNLDSNYGGAAVYNSYVGGVFGSGTGHVNGTSNPGAYPSNPTAHPHVTNVNTASAQTMSESGLNRLSATSTGKSDPASGALADVKPVR